MNTRRIRSRGVGGKTTLQNRVREIKLSLDEEILSGTEGTQYTTNFIERKTVIWTGVNFLCVLRSSAPLRLSPFTNSLPQSRRGTQRYTELDFRIFRIRKIRYLVNPVNPLEKTTLILATLLLFAIPSDLRAQNGWSLNTSESLTSWVALDAPPGREHLATDTILQVMPGWKRDALGNLMLRKGSGSPRRVVACGIDRPGFAVTEITNDGYLRLREVGAGRQHPLWVQFHEGQPIRVLTRGGPVHGVVILKSTHLQRGRVANAPLTTLDDLWVDVGATSKADVQRLGVEMLDPIVRDASVGRFNNYVSGHLAGVRVGCAAVATAASKQVTTGETIFLLTTLRSFGYDGLEAALRTLGRVDEVTLVDQIADTASGADGVVQRKVEKPSYLPASTGLTSLTMLGPRVRYAGRSLKLFMVLTLRTCSPQLKKQRESMVVRIRVVHVGSQCLLWVRVHHGQRTLLTALRICSKRLRRSLQCRDTRDLFARQSEKLFPRGLDRTHALILKGITFSKLDQIAIR